MSMSLRASPVTGTFFTAGGLVTLTGIPDCLESWLLKSAKGMELILSITSPVLSPFTPNLISTAPFDAPAINANAAVTKSADGPVVMSRILTLSAGTPIILAIPPAIFFWALLSFLKASGLSISILKATVAIDASSSATDTFSGAAVGLAVGFGFSV